MRRMARMDDRSDLLREQLDYYRARAAEYDVTSYGIASGERASVPGIVDRLAPTGDVLEMACGTGIWTVELARWATTVTAVDGAAEMLALAAQRTVGHDVRLVHADVFAWTPPADYDVVFFAAWLSHVPVDVFGAFWDRVRAALRPGGRVLFLDELPARSGVESFLADGLVTRTLADGSQHRVVKIFYEPEALVGALRGIGWRATVTPIEHGWFVGEAVPAGLS